VAERHNEFYLSAIAAGQEDDSPCIDAGEDLASSVCYDQGDSQVCLDELSTRTDGETDLETVDMGFHYPEGASVSPTPTATCIHHGDVNFSGDITAGDAQLAFQITLGGYTPSYEEACAADCNGDMDVTAGDAQIIFLAALGLDSCVDPIP